LQSIGNESTQGKHKRIFVTIELLRPINIIRNSFVFKQLLGIADFWGTYCSSETYKNIKNKLSG
jgi:hypothetical protein